MQCAGLTASAPAPSDYYRGGVYVSASTFAGTRFQDFALSNFYGCVTQPDAGALRYTCKQNVTDLTLTPPAVVAVCLYNCFNNAAGTLDCYTSARNTTIVPASQSICADPVGPTGALPRASSCTLPQYPALESCCDDQCCINL